VRPYHEPSQGEEHRIIRGGLGSTLPIPLVPPWRWCVVVERWRAVAWESGVDG
jgi:hypothetical protein